MNNNWYTKRHCSLRRNVIKLMHTPTGTLLVSQLHWSLYHGEKQGLTARQDQNVLVPTERDSTGLNGCPFTCVPKQKLFKDPLSHHFGIFPYACFKRNRSCLNIDVSAIFQICNKYMSKPAHSYFYKEELKSDIVYHLVSSCIFND